MSTIPTYVLASTSTTNPCSLLSKAGATIMHFITNMHVKTTTLQGRHSLVDHAANTDDRIRVSDPNHHHRLGVGIIPHIHNPSTWSEYQSYFPQDSRAHKHMKWQASSTLSPPSSSRTICHKSLLSLCYLPSFFFPYSCPQSTQTTSSMTHTCQRINSLNGVRPSTLFSSGAPFTQQSHPSSTTTDRPHTVHVHP